MTPSTVQLRVSSRSSLEPLKVPSMVTLDAIQHFPPDVQLQSLALCLAAMCRPLSIDPHDLITRANKQLIEADATRQPIIEAIGAYAGGELK